MFKLRISNYSLRMIKETKDWKELMCVMRHNSYWCLQVVITSLFFHPLEKLIYSKRSIKGHLSSKCTLKFTHF